MGINRDFLRRCPGTIERALGEPGRSNPDHTVYGIHCSACIKEFEMSSWSKVAGYG